MVSRQFSGRCLSFKSGNRRVVASCTFIIIVEMCIRDRRYEDKIEILFSQHHWPRIGKENIKPVSYTRLDVYKRQGFAALASQSPLPVVAIGGLDAERARQVRATGTASRIAVVSAICGAENPDCLLYTSRCV